MNNSALLVIDMQIGLLQRQVYNKQELIDNINRLIEHYHMLDLPVYFFRHTNQSFSQRNSDAWQLCNELERNETDVIYDKEQSSVFKEKTFKSTIDDKHINNIVVTGLVSNGCVQAACIDGKKLGYHVNLISDAHSTFHKDAEQVIMDWNQKLQREGVTVNTTEEYLMGLEQQ